MKTIHIELAKKHKAKKKPKSNRSAFMKALMTQFAKQEPEMISDAFVNKDSKNFAARFQKITDELIKQATPKDQPEDEKDQTSVTAKVRVLKPTLASKMHEVSVKGHFYPFKTAELLQRAKSCKCDKYDCMNCQCRKQAVREKLMTQDESDEIVFGK